MRNESTTTNATKTKKNVSLLITNYMVIYRFEKRCGTKKPKSVIYLPTNWISDVNTRFANPKFNIQSILTWNCFLNVTINVNQSISKEIGSLNKKKSIEMLFALQKQDPITNELGFILVCVFFRSNVDIVEASSFILSLSN